MKKVLLLILIISLSVVFVGCSNKKTENVEVSSGENISNNNEENKTSGEEAENGDALSAISEKLEDEEWVSANLKLAKTCFGEDVVSGDQELCFAKFGDDKVVVRAYAYDDNNFGEAVTLVYYKNGQVMTFGNPSIYEPYHPGHVGFNFDLQNEVMVSYYSHMGYYAETYFKWVGDHFELLANYEWTEFDDEAHFLENESGEAYVNYTVTKGEETIEGSASFEEVESMIAEDMKEYTLVILDTPLTNENVELYVK